MEEEQPIKKSPENLPTISFNDVPLPVIPKPVEPENPVLQSVSLEQLAAWKQSGDYAQLERYIRSGALEILPKEVLFDLVRAKQEHYILVDTIRLVLETVLPLAQKQDQLSVYVNPASKLKINISKVMEEVVLAQTMNAFKKDPKPIPFIALFQDNIRTEKFKEIDVEKLEVILKNNDMDFQIFIDLVTRLGIVEIPNNE